MPQEPAELCLGRPWGAPGAATNSEQQPTNGSAAAVASPRTPLAPGRRRPRLLPVLVDPGRSDAQPKELVGRSGAVSICQGNCISQIHSYPHTFETVVEAYLLRFPTHPKMPIMVDSVVSNRQELVDEGRVVYERTVVAAADDVPWLVRKATGLTQIKFKATMIEDYRARKMTVISENVSMRKHLVLDETTIYCADPFDPNCTYFEQVATLSLPGLPSKAAKTVERFLSKKYEQGCDDGRVVDLELAEEVRAKKEPPPTWVQANPEKEAALLRKHTEVAGTSVTPEPRRPSLSPPGQNRNTRIDGVLLAPAMRASASIPQDAMPARSLLGSWTSDSPRVLDFDAVREYDEIKDDDASVTGELLGRTGKILALQPAPEPGPQPELNAKLATAPADPAPPAPPLVRNSLTRE